MYMKNFLVFRMANVRATRCDGIDGVESTGSGIAAQRAVTRLHGIWNMP
jgi:hypothetical protein